MKKVFLSLILFLVFFTVGGIIKTQAGPTPLGPNVIGWIWGGSEEVNDGIINGNETGLGWISLNNVDENGIAIYGNVSYGVYIPTSSGDLEGHAWSEYLGYIDFENSDCPTVNFNLADYPHGCRAQKIGNKLAGFARIEDIRDAASMIPSNSGGWEGFIDLSNVSISGNTLSGYGWNGETQIGETIFGLGFIDFTGAKIVSAKNLSATLSAQPNIGNSHLTPKMTVEVTGTANGNIKYELDCDCGEDGIYDYNDANHGPTSETSYTFDEGECTYSGEGEDILSARARVTRGGIEAESNPVSIHLNPCYCLDDEEAKEHCTTETYVNSCGRNCNGTRDCTWKEVAP